MADEIKKIGLSITVDDGFQKVPINNKFGDEVGVFYFNPTDMGIIQRFNEFAAGFDYITEPLEASTLSKKKGNDDTINQEALDEATNRLYERMNKLFNGDMAGAFFGNVHPFSPVGEGDDCEFYCVKALEAVREFISQQFSEAADKINARVKKYTNVVKKK